MTIDMHNIEMQLSASAKCAFISIDSRSVSKSPAEMGGIVLHDTNYAPSWVWASVFRSRATWDFACDGAHKHFTNVCIWLMAAGVVIVGGVAESRCHHLNSALSAINNRSFPAPCLQMKRAR